MRRLLSFLTLAGLAAAFPFTPLAAAEVPEALTAPAEVDPATPVPWGTPGGWAAVPLYSQPESVIGSDDRVQITNTHQDPWKRNVQLEVTFPGGSGTCSGFFLAPNLVGTAGHCVYNSTFGGWATNINVVPGRNGIGGGASEPFGRQSIASAWSVSGWVTSGLSGYDYGAVLLPDDTLGNLVGEWYHLLPLATSDVAGFLANISGYPGDKPPGTQWYDGQGVTSVGDMVSYETDTAGGQSGSAVYTIGDIPRRYVFAVHAYGVGPLPCATGDNCGPRMRPDLLSFYYSLGAPLFSDNFETGLTGAWSTVVQ